MALVLAGVQLYVRYSLGLAVANALYLQGVVLALSFVPLFFANTLVTAIGAGLLVGVGYSGMLATNDLIIARVLDDDVARHGVHREGLFLSRSASSAGSTPSSPVPGES